MEYQLVPMDRSHLSGVAELERLCFSTPWNETMLEEELFNPTASFIVAEGAEGEVLGYAGLHVVLDEGYIDNVAVRHPAAGRGLETGCWSVLPLWAGPPGLSDLGARPSNQAAVALYCKHGFQEAGRRKDYYQDPTEDALLLTRTFVR